MENVWLKNNENFGLWCLVSGMDTYLSVNSSIFKNLGYGNMVKNSPNFGYGYVFQISIFFFFKIYEYLEKYF